MSRKFKEDVSYFKNCLSESTYCDANGKKFIVLQEPTVLHFLNAGSKGSISSRLKKINNSFDGTDLECKFLYHRFYSSDNQKYARESLGNTYFKYTAELYDTFSRITQTLYTNKTRVNDRTALCIVYERDVNFDFKSAFNVFNKSLIDYVNKKPLDDFKFRALDDLYPVGLKYKLKTDSEMYLHNYYVKHPTKYHCTTRTSSSTPQYLLKDMKDKSKELIKELIDNKEFKFVEDFCTEMKDLMIDLRKEARINDRYGQYTLNW